jgi:uncharacterized protein YlxP (DUF503 family)
MEQQIRAYIVLVSFEVLVNGSTSLKMKRSVINRIKDRLRSRLNASVAEIGHLDKWQRAAMALTMISNDKKKLQKDADTVETLLLGFTDVSISQLTVEWL